MRVPVEAAAEDPRNTASPNDEDAAVGGHQVVAAVVGHGGHAADRVVRATGRRCEPRNGGVAEGEDAAVGGHQPVAAPLWVAAMPVTGATSGVPPIEPRKGASPKANTPPSEATSQ